MLNINLKWFDKNVDNMNDKDIELFARDYFIKCMPDGYIELFGIPDNKKCMDWLCTDYGLYLLENPRS